MNEIFLLTMFINLDVLRIQVRPEVPHAEARDNCAHEGEAVQVRPVQLPDGHALHPQQARLSHPQGGQGLPVPGEDCQEHCHFQKNIPKKLAMGFGHKSLSFESNAITEDIGYCDYLGTIHKV